jgi:hypothetical protein
MQPMHKIFNKKLLGHQILIVGLEIIYPTNIILRQLKLNIPYIISAPYDFSHGMAKLVHVEVETVGGRIKFLFLQIRPFWADNYGLCAATADRLTNSANALLSPISVSLWA